MLKITGTYLWLKESGNGILDKIIKSHEKAEMQIQLSGPMSAF